MSVKITAILSIPGRSMISRDGSLKEANSFMNVNLDELAYNAMIKERPEKLPKHVQWGTLDNEGKVRVSLEQLAKSYNGTLTSFVILD